MLINHSKSPSFSRTLKYILKPGSRIIGGNVIGQDLKRLNREFNMVAQLRPEIKHPVYHAYISAAPDEAPSDQVFAEFGKDFIKGMRFVQNQFLIVRHTEQEHEHIHILGNRIGWNRLLVSDSWDYRRAERVLQELKEKYGFAPIAPSWERAEHAPSFAEHYRQEQEQKEFEQGLRDTAPTPSVRQQLLAGIKANVGDQPNLPTLIDRLQDIGIEVKVYLDRTPHGISFQLSDVKFAGGSLGRGYSFNGLQSHFQVTYEPERDDDSIRALMQQPVAVAVAPQAELGLDLERNVDEDVDRCPQQSEQEWRTIRQVIQPYHFDHNLIHHLYQANVLRLDKKKRLAFGERSLTDQETGSIALNPNGSFERESTLLTEGSFWMARGESINQIVIAPNPLQAIAAYSLDEMNPNAKNTLYLAAASPVQLPDRLSELNHVYYSSQCNSSIKTYLQEWAPNAEEITVQDRGGWIEDWQQQQRSLQNPSQSIREVKELELEL